MNKSDFFYHLPQHLIAQQPLPERSDSRMLLVDPAQGNFRDKQFIDFLELINNKDLLIFNDTKVMPARLYGSKISGGKVELLIERIIDRHNAVVHIRASKAPKTDTQILLEQGFSCVVLGREEDLFRVQFEQSQSVLEILAAIGHIPLPPYIARPDQHVDQQRYQTVFARHSGAVAAPTAGLHFDDSMLSALNTKGVASTFVTLHVGSGTFQPVRVEDLAQHRMHKEYYDVSTATVEAIQHTREQGGRIVAIGTTAVRALESVAAQGELKPGCGDTELFITPGYQFNVVDAMLTNFHLPESTLLMLIAAFAGYELIQDAYAHAVNQEYRFFSYGDAMFINNRQNS